MHVIGPKNVRRGREEAQGRMPAGEEGLNLFQLDLLSA